MRRFSKPSPALVIACLALFVALGGVSYGVATGSIDSREIKDGTIAGKDLRNRSLQGTKIRRNRVGGNAVKESALGKVPGAAEADSLSDGARVVTRTADSLPTADNDGTQNGVERGAVLTAGAVASCAPGERLLTGGARWVAGNEGNNENLYINESYPQGNTWVAQGIVDFGAQGLARLRAVAVCLK